MSNYEDKGRAATLRSERMFDRPAVEPTQTDVGARFPWFKLALTIMPAAFLMQVDKQGFAVLAPLIQKELNVDLVTIAWILAITAWSYAAFQIPGAWLAARLGPLLTLGLCVLGWSCAVVITPLAIGPMSLMFVRASMRAMQAPDWLSSVMILEREVPVALRSRGSGALLAASYFGIVLTGPLAVAVATHLGWRACFEILGVIGCVFAIGLLLYARSSRHMPTTTKPKKAPYSFALAEALKDPRIHALAFTYFSFSAVQSFVYVMLPLYLAHDRHTSLTHIGWLSSAPFVTLYLAVVTAGFLSDALWRRFRSLFVARGLLGGLAMFCSSACFAVGMSMSQTTATLVLTCAGMAFVGIGDVALWSAVQDTKPGAGGFKTAWVQILGAVGFGLAPLIAAKMVETSGRWGEVRFLLLASGVVAAASLLMAQIRPPTVNPGTAESAR